MSANKARAIFVELLSKVPQEDWERSLDELAAGDEDLRSKVAALLAAHRQADSFLEHPAGPLGGTVDVPAPVASPRVTNVECRTVEGAGLLLAGRYKLVEALGEGGMGAVWMAQQTEPVKRLVAIKLIKPGMDSKQVLARFEAERQALALMDHPNIAKVLDAGATATGRPYFVMELVKGTPLTKYCDEHRLTPKQRLELFVPVCQAIQHAHQKGIIHRDIKPSNVLVALYDGKPVPKVIDFGIAKATGQQLTDHTLVTGFGAVVGTLEYMSPEQAEHNQLDIDTRSDIYSLGVLLYELLTGSTPLEKKRLKEAALLEVLRLIREEEPPRPSTRLADSKDTLPAISAQRQTEPAKLTRLVRGELDWIVMKALEKDRGRRYETATGFAADVQRYLNDEPVQACPPSGWYRLRKLVRRNRGPVLAASLFVLLLMAGSVGTTAGLVRALAAEGEALSEGVEKDKARRQAVTLARTEAEARRQTRQALNTMTDAVLEELLGRQVELTDQHREFLNKVLAYHAAFAATKADDPEGIESRASGYFRVAGIRQRLGDFKEAEAAYRDAWALQKQLAADFPTAPDYQMALANTLTDLGILLRHTVRQEEAEPLYHEVLARERQLVADFPDRPGFRRALARAHYNLAILLHKAGRYKEAELAYHDALTLQTKLMADFPRQADPRHQLAKTYTSLGNLLKDTGRPTAAAEAWRKALAQQKLLAKIFPQRPGFRQDLALSLNNLGILLRTWSRLDEAEVAFREALLLQNELSADYPNRPDLRSELAGSYHNLGVLLHVTGRLREAGTAWGEALALRKQLAAGYPKVPEYQNQLAGTLAGLGTVPYVSGRADQAESACREAVAIGKRLTDKFRKRPEFRQNLALSFSTLGLLLRNENRLGEAELAYHDALNLWKQLAAEFPNRPEFRKEQAQTHNNLGFALATMRQPKKAELAYHDALSLWKQLVAESPKWPEYRQEQARTYDNLNNLLRASHRLGDAESAWRKALKLRKSLVADFPKVPDFQNALAGTLVNLAFLHTQRREPAVAVALLEEARPHHLAALKANPRNAQYRRFYRNHLLVRARTYLGLGDHTRAATVGNELAHFGFEPASDVYDVACFLSCCVTLAEKDSQLAEPRREELAQSYADRALTLLREAVVTHGFRDAAHMKQNRDLAPLRARDEFRQLLTYLEGKANP
jgi:serine/threonine protein kinase/tetratricopeptide (TPR) repeat protein